MATSDGSPRHAPTAGVGRMTARRYGQWAGDESGTVEDPLRCVASVPNPAIARGFVQKQCPRQRGFGPDGLYCKRHARISP